MYEKEQLCEKIKSIYPDIGECGIDLAVRYDKAQESWVVDLKKGKKELKTYLMPEEADQCMQGKQCVSLGIQVAQLRADLERKPS
jgi:hypothetical protein